MRTGAESAASSHGDTMRTRRNQSLVSAVLELPGARLAALLVVGACAGWTHPVTQGEHTEAAESTASTMAAAPQTAMLQFDNQATVYVDVYLVGDQLQWRLGRVPPGFRAMLRVPESASPWALGLVQLAVIPGSQVSAEARRDPRAVIAVAQPMSEMLSQRWTFRQPVGKALQLQATRLTGRQ